MIAHNMTQAEQGDIWHNLVSEAKSGMDSSSHLAVPLVHCREDYTSAQNMTESQQRDLLHNLASSAESRMDSSSPFV